MAIQIPVLVKNIRCFHTVIDEGVSTCIMLIKFWKSLGSPTLNQSSIILKAFDGRGFHPYGILQDLPKEVEGKTVNLDVEVVDAPLDYNLLLGHNWSYAMTVIVSSVFRLIMFPHKGNIVKIDQLMYFHPIQPLQIIFSILENRLFPIRMSELVCLKILVC